MKESKITCNLVTKCLISWFRLGILQLQSKNLLKRYFLEIYRLVLGTINLNPSFSSYKKGLLRRQLVKIPDVFQIRILRIVRASAKSF